MKKNGFIDILIRTLIELMIVVAILGIISAIIIDTMRGNKANKTNISRGVNGSTEIRCIEGYKFVIDRKGSVQQIMNNMGQGVSCDSSSMEMGK